MVGLCRLCASLRKMDILITIKNDSNEMCEKLRKCCQLDIKMSDALPKSICPDCIENLNNYHLFYNKVRDAQETLKALFSSHSSHQEKANEATPPHIVQNVAVHKENSKQIPYEVKCDKTKLAKANKCTENALKQKKSKKYILEQTKDAMKESKADRNSKGTSQLQEEVVHEFYILKVSKEKSICDSYNDQLETQQESIEDLIENETGNVSSYRDICDQQLIDEHHTLDDNNEHNPLPVSNEDYLESDEVIKQINHNGMSVTVEYMDYYEDAEEENEVDRNRYISQSLPLSSKPSQLKLSSWKNYKFLCAICDDIFSTFIDLKVHMTQKHEHIYNFPYKCYDCPKIMPRYNCFLNHVRSRHHHELKLKCDVCDLSCQNFQDLSYHRSVKCPEAVNHAYAIACDKCFKSFHNTFGLRNHIKYQHTSSKTKVKYKCAQCNKEFRYKSCLKSHEHVHTDIKNFSCSYCDRSFHNKFGLEQHQLCVHVDGKKFQCNICNKSYKSFQSLDEHRKLHSDKKTFKCQFCEKYFMQKIQKLTHERSHTGEMPFPCAQCDKRFRYSSALFAHSKVHSGFKPYSCEYCSKTFADSSNRNKHVRRMHFNYESQTK